MEHQFEWDDKVDNQTAEHVGFFLGEKACKDPECSDTQSVGANMSNYGGFCYRFSGVHRLHDHAINLRDVLNLLDSNKYGKNQVGPDI